MTAYVAQHSDIIGSYIKVERYLSPAQGPEALAVKHRREEAIMRSESPSRMSWQVAANANDPAAGQLRKMVETVIGESEGYASITYIARNANVSVAQAEAILKEKSIFRKSFIRTKDGSGVYMLNRPYSWLRDAWATFRCMNWIKY